MREHISVTRKTALLLSKIIFYQMESLYLNRKGIKMKKYQPLVKGNHSATWGVGQHQFSSPLRDPLTF